MGNQHFNFGGTISQLHISQINPSAWEPNEEPLNLRVRKSLKDAVEAYAKSLNISVSSAARRLIVSGFKYERIKSLTLDELCSTAEKE